MSERKLATIRIVKAIDPIPGADKIEKVTVDGWELVAQKDLYTVGSKVVYCEIDSYLPIKPEYEFLRKSSYKAFVNGVEGFRLKTIKLRGQISQGLLLPLEVIKTWKMRLIGTSAYPVGTDVTDILGIMKYEPELLGQVHLKRSYFVRRYLQVKWFLKNLFMTSEQKKKQPGSFPSFIRKTDEERIQNLDIKKFRGQRYEVTEKLDGTSCSIAYYNDTFYVCSRNNKVGLQLGEENQSIGAFSGAYWKIALKYGLEEKLKAFTLRTGDSIAIQGEIVGPGIQKNKYKLTETEFYVYKIWCINRQIFAGSVYRYDICKEMGLKQVPILEYAHEFKFDNVADILTYSEGESKICGSQEREGVVFKEISGDHSFKVINNKFLLKNGE